MSEDIVFGVVVMCISTLYPEVRYNQLCYCRVLYRLKKGFDWGMKITTF